MPRKKKITISSIVISAVIILTLAVYLPLTIAANSSDQATEAENSSVNEAIDDDDGMGDVEDADEPGDIDEQGDTDDVDEADDDDDGPNEIEDDD